MNRKYYLGIFILYKYQSGLSERKRERKRKKKTERDEGRERQ